MKCRRCSNQSVAVAAAFVSDNANGPHTSNGPYNSDRSNNSAPAELEPLRPAVLDPTRSNTTSSSRAGRPSRSRGAHRSRTYTSPVRSNHNYTSNSAGRDKRIGRF
jgi:hypothetical protein